MGKAKEMKFVADSMLGKLAKWLRVLGHDTHYQRYYSAGTINQLVDEGRYLLSRHRETAKQYNNVLLLHSNNVGDQLAELKELVDLASARSKWFTRCLICNDLLENVQLNKAQENVPEYVFYHNASGIRHCPSCARYYWPGSHRKNMVRQLEKWGFTPFQVLKDPSGNGTPLPA